MKKYYLLALLLVATPALAQQKSLFDSDVPMGGYGGPSIKVTSVNDQLGLMVGGTGAWVLDNSLIIGGAGYGLTTETMTQGLGADTTQIDMGYGGGIVGYQFMTNEIVHFGVQTLIGAGGVTYQRRDNDENGSTSDNADGFLVVEPGVNLELNVAKNIRVSLEGSYRFINGAELPGTTNSSLGGPSAALTVKFGSF